MTFTALILKLVSDAGQSPLKTQKALLKESLLIKQAPALQTNESDCS